MSVPGMAFASRASGPLLKGPNVASSPSGTATAPSLALAVIASSSTPVLMLDGKLAVIAASASFCRSFNIAPAEVSGRPLADLGAGEWGERRLASLLRTTASGHAAIEAYEFDLVRQGQATRKLIVNAQLLWYADEKAVRLLVGVADVTDARLAEKLKDDLVREKEILLQELQHRIANSLQIIASVLMLSARGVQSEETRGHLRNAHQRVLSMASVQQQLAVSKSGYITLKTYLTELCQSLDASMIGDHRQISIRVEVDGSIANADTSVSLGLIVTELVINALKHAFPDARHGEISVRYFSHGLNWTLSVSDDGIGIATGARSATAGLGTSIVSALAKQLLAKVTVIDSAPGTSVLITHTEVAAVGTSLVPAVQPA